MSVDIKKTKLQEWLATLKEKADWKKIKDLESTHIIYMNPSTIKMLDYIIKKIGKHNDRDFDNHMNFYKKSKIKMSDKQWGDANSEISKACATYQLISLMLEDDYAQLKLQQYFLEKGMTKLMETTARKNTKNFEKSPIDHSYIGSIKTRFHELEHMHIANKNSRKGLMDLGNLDESVELFYHENKLKILCEKISRASYQSHVLTADEKKWIDKIPKKIIEFPQIVLYSLTYKMILEGDEIYFNELKEKLEFYFNSHAVTKNYVKNFYEYLLVFCTRKINIGNSKYAENYLNIFSLMLEKGVMYDQGSLPAWRFKNVIKGTSKLLWLEGANHLDIFEQMDSFITGHEDKLILESRIPIVNYCKAFVEYLKGNYSDSEELLNKTEKPKDDLIKIEYYFLLMFIHLENEQRDEFITASENLSSMIYYARKKLSKISFDRRKVAISFIKKVQKDSQGTKSNHFQDCLDEVIASENFFGKDWLLAYLKRKIGE